MFYVDKRYQLKPSPFTKKVRKASPIHKLIEVPKQSNFGTGQQLKVNYMFLDNTIATYILFRI